MTCRHLNVAHRTIEAESAHIRLRVIFCGRRPLPFGGSHLRLPSGPAGIRTTTGRLSALARPTPYQLSHRVASHSAQGEACPGFLYHLFQLCASTVRLSSTKSLLKSYSQKPCVAELNDSTLLTSETRPNGAELNATLGCTISSVTTESVAALPMPPPQPGRSDPPRFPLRDIFSQGWPFATNHAVAINLLPHCILVKFP